MPHEDETTLTLRKVLLSHKKPMIPPCLHMAASQLPVKLTAMPLSILMPNPALQSQFLSSPRYLPDIRDSDPGIWGYGSMESLQVFEFSLLLPPRFIPFKLPGTY